METRKKLKELAGELAFNNVIFNAQMGTSFTVQDFFAKKITLKSVRALGTFIKKQLNELVDEFTIEETTEDKLRAELELKLEFLKTYIAYQKELQEANRKRQESVAFKAKVKEILQEKQFNNLSSMSEEELRKLLEE